MDNVWMKVGYSQNVLDLFMDPSTVPCFLLGDTVFWLCVVMCLVSAFGFLRLLYIVFHWSYFSFDNSIETIPVQCHTRDRDRDDYWQLLLDELRGKPRLQIIGLRLVGLTCSFALFLHKLTMATSSYAPIGQDLFSTCLYSLTCVAVLACVQWRLLQVK
jgi:hypothetical protein